MFVCPICKSSSFSELLSEIFKCDGCSALFADPRRFGSFSNNEGVKTNIDKENQTANAITTNKQGAFMRPMGGVGAVVSKPMKIKRN